MSGVYSCFDVTSNVGMVADEASSDSVSALLLVFTRPLALAATIKTVPGGSGAADANDWGQLVRTSQDGHLATYLKDLGAGQLIVTFVIWA